jgi:hypothetical protein
LLLCPCPAAATTREGASGTAYRTQGDQNSRTDELRGMADRRVRGREPGGGISGDPAGGAWAGRCLIVRA